ncbi:hypothetical protein GA830_08805 [Mesorhizobium sp. NBSH29]|uniref:hypothetical protein n=1 Tax=Mesorhizobium sp. NBSH29 TaxID=2654249 RepID=UPI0018964295|nr:hypothetical protein [Mesorhizobium sp. NBSH29]QPC86826.1 hypothetical protein GA830_08805 [Mesorhizobium sp. NBSH29]
MITRRKPIRNILCAEVQEAETEMKPLRITLLSFFMLFGISAWGVAIYIADEATGHAVVDGYGVSAQVR